MLENIGSYFGDEPELEIEQHHNYNLQQEFDAMMSEDHEHD